MVLTVRDILGFKSLEGVRVIAGEDSLGNAVLSASVMEVPDIDPWVKEGDLLLTTLYPIKSDAGSQDTLIPRLVKRGLAGLAIKPGRYVDEIPRSIIQSAEEIGFPLLELAPQASFNEIIIEILTTLLGHRARQLERSERIDRQFTKIALQGGGLPAISATLSSLLGTTVSVHDAKGRLVALSGGAAAKGSPAESVELERAMSGLAAHPRRCRNTDEPLSVRVRVGEVVTERVVYQVSVDERVLGYLCAWASGGELPPDYVFLLPRVAAVAALEFVKQRAVEEVERRFRSDFLDDLLAGEIGATDLIVQRARIYGWDLGAPHVLLVVAVDGEEIHSHGDQERLWNTKQEVLLVTSQVAVALHPQAIVADKSGTIVVLLPAAGSGDPACLRARAGEVGRRIVREVAKHIPGVTVSIGIGRFFPQPVDLPRAYDDAQQALRVIRSLGETGMVMHFDDLGVCRLLAAFQGNRELEAFCSEHIGTLVRHDRQHESDLLRTLEAYLDRNRQLKPTAQALFIHYNTLRYRLKKIENLTRALKKCLHGFLYYAILYVGDVAYGGIIMAPRGILVAHGNRQRERVLENLDVIVGTVVESYRTCGKPGCGCREGQKHGPYYLLTWSEGGRTKTQHIPREKLAEVRRMTRNYQVARKALRKLGEFNRRLVLEG